MKKKKLYLVFFILFIFLSYGSNYGHAQEQNKQIIITIDGLTVEEFFNLSSLNLNKEIAYGLVSPYTKGRLGDLNQYITLGLGRRVDIGGNKSTEAFNADEIINEKRTSDIYFEQTGLKSSLENLCLLDFPDRFNKIRELSKVEHFGYLGSELKANNISRLIIGDTDLYDINNRYTPYLICDQNGLVDKGIMGDKIQRTESIGLAFYPHNYTVIKQKFLENKDKSELLILEFGDILKLEKTKNSFSEQRLLDLRKSLINQIDLSVKDIFENVNFANTRIIILVPNLSNTSKNPKGLFPIAISGKGIENSILVSATTQRTGIISNVDLAPSILNYYDIKIPSWMEGDNILTVNKNNPKTYLEKLNNKTNFIYEARPIILKMYIFIQIFIISIFSVLLIKKVVYSSLFLKLFVFSLIIPISLLWIAIFPVLNYFSFIINFIIISSIIMLICFVSAKLSRINILTFICLFSSFSILLDVFLGSKLMKLSVLGYCPIRGARFYGLGNEYMGILIGSLIMGLSLYLEKKKITKTKLLVTGVIFLICLLFIALPSLGTNVGGTMAAFVGFSIVLLRLANFPLNYKLLLSVGGSMVIVLILLFVYDIYLSPGQTSHIGKFADLVRNGDFISVIDIFIRKIAINIKLIRYSNWSILFFVSILSLIFALYKPFGFISKIYDSYPILSKGFIGVITASLIALIFNDSGIVAAATMMLFPINILLYVAQKKI
ncbi:hypothetical protein [Desulfonispora thiosulfatigenes]|nr:hypothetical protein [Desulfonispora thiosulfatigenes]